MQELEKILEEIDIKISGSMGRKREGLSEAREIIRKHMNDGWIPVDERLPEDDSTKRYIVTDTDGHVWSSIWYGYAEEENKTPCFYCWDDDMWQCYKPDVIAWRPLPEPYQPEQTAKRPEWQERMLHTFLGGHT